MTDQAIGSLDILNVTEGEVKISFDKTNAADKARAKHVIEDMLKRGYALLVELPDGQIVRAEGFDAETDSYLVASWPTPEAEAAEEAPSTPKRGRKKVITKVAASSVRATGVARTAGG